MLRVAGDPLGRVVRAHLPADGEAEHRGHHRQHAVGADRRALGDLGVQPLNVLELDRRYLHLAERGQDVVRDDRPVIDLRVRPLLGDVLLDEPGAQIGHGRRGAIRNMLANGIAPAVNVALERLGLLARGRNRPVRERADGVATLEAIGLAPVIQDRRMRASTLYV